MLLLEQYLAIYFLAVFLVSKRDVKILCGFLAIDFLVDSALFHYLSFSPQEYLIIKTILEAVAVIFLLQFVKCFKLRNIFILCYVSTLINPLFLLSLDHWITRNDIISTALFIFCMHIGRYSNELFLTYIIYTTKEKSMKTNFWQLFIACNYITILLR